MTVHQIHNSSPYMQDEWEREHREAVRRHGRKADAVLVMLGALCAVVIATFAIAGVL